MTKKTYIQPSITVASVQYQQLIATSDVRTTSTSSDVDLKYDKNGASADDAW